MKGKSKRLGFTLIELLVVIAIIAILAAILFPVFAQAREAARKTACASNLKQLGTAVLMYQTDYDGTYPYWNWGLNYGGQGNMQSLWTTAIFPYVKSAGLYKCPSDAAEWGYATTDGEWWGPTKTERLRDAPMFEDANRGPDGGHDRIPVGYGMGETIHNMLAKDSSIPAPASTALLADSVSMLGDLWGQDNGPQPRIAMRMACANGQASGTQGNGGAYAWDPAWDKDTRHQGGLNVAFADGHVKWMRGSKMNESLTLPPK